MRLRRVQVALELAEDLHVRLADDVGQHVEPAAVRHADHDLVEPVLGGLIDPRVHHRDHGFRTFERESFLTNVFGLQERLERLSRIELGQDVLLLGDRRLLVLDLDAFLQPLLLFGFEDVGVLDTDVTAVGVAQQPEHVAQLLVLGAPEAVDLELAVQVPQRQAMRVHIEVGVAAEAGLVQPQRVDVGHQMAAVAVGRDQLEDAAVLVLDRVGVVGAPAHRLVRDAQLAEDLVEEVVAQQEFVHRAQEVAGLRTLDDAVVVGRREGDQLADAQLGDAFGAGALELGRVLHRADADDRALTAHQPRHRVHRADGAGVGQRNRHAAKVFGGQLAVTGTTDDVLVAGEELGEPHGLGVLDARHDQLTVAVLALQVDREPEVDVFGGHGVGLAVDLGEVAVHVRELLDRLHQRVADQVGERDLAAASALEVVVDDDAVVDQQLGRDGPHAGRGRHLQRRRHVLDDRGRRAAQHLYLRARCRGRRRGLLRLGGRRLGPCPRPCLPSGLRCGRGRERSCSRPPSAGVRARVRAALPVRAPVVRCRRWFDCRWSARGSSRQGIHANWDPPRRGPRGTCDTSPRPATRSARMVKVSSRQLLASIPSLQASAPRSPRSVRLPAYPPSKG